MEIVSFDLAKKLKERGFNWLCSHYYRLKCKDLFRVYPCEDWSDIEERINAPTISQVLKWLRESKKMFVQIEINGMGYIVSIYRRKYFDSELIYPLKNKFDTYEHAALAGIEYCLDNLI